MTNADWQLDETGIRTLHVSGDWTALALGDAAMRLRSLPSESLGVLRLDHSNLGRIDTAGALVLLRSMVPGADIDFGDRDDLKRLINLVRPPLEDGSPDKSDRTERYGFLERFGRQVTGIGGDAYQMLVFIGQLIAALGRTIGNPGRLRMTPLVSSMQDVGVNALPIVFVMTFFIGAVIALVGTNLLTTLGVEVFTIQLVGVAILREFGVVITAILLSGRSASSFAAQIGGFLAET